MDSQERFKYRMERQTSQGVLDQQAREDQEGFTKEVLGWGLEE